MIYRLTADLVVLIHLGLSLLAVLGGLLVLRYRRCALLHLPPSSQLALWPGVGLKFDSQQLTQHHF